MSSDGSDAGNNRQKRKIRRLSDNSHASSSSLSPIIGGPSCRRRRKIAFIREESSDTESSDGSDLIVKRKKIARVQSESDLSSNDDDSSPKFVRKKHPRVFVSPSESSTGSDSDIVRRRVRHAAPLSINDSESSDSQWESDFSESERESSNKSKTTTLTVQEEKAIDSDSSDGQSEKCPICLLSFRLQEVGVPENCEHTFCLECIQEWSKNMNTCPVDRKEYNSITAKKSLNGKVLRKISIEKPNVQEEAMDIIEDPTFCEICGSNDHEDRLLLCDGCDLGFHLYCLTPPLDEVPEGSWFCSECFPGVNQNIDIEEVARLYEDAEEYFGDGLVFGRRRQLSNRLVPRTRQSERVRRRIETNRNQRQLTNMDVENRPSTSTGIVERIRSNRVTSTTRNKKQRRKKTKKSKSTRYRTIYVIDDITGEAVPVKKKMKSRKRSKRSKKKKAKSSTSAVPKTVKKRLAAQLGMCTINSVPQSIPDIRSSVGNSTNLAQSRYQAGIPGLDLVGNRNQLDFFSQSEDEGIFNDSEVGGVHTLLARRVPNPLDVMSFQRIARRKSALVNVPTVSSSTDILGSIMDSQETFLSKNSVISVLDSSGKLVIEKKKSNPILNNNVPNKPNFNSFTVKEKPWYGGRNNTGYRYHNNRNWSNNRNWQNNPRGNQGGYYSGSQNNHGSASSSRSNYMGGSNQNNDIPQDYTQRTLCEAEMLQETDDKDKRTPESNTPVSETDVDIYGDIENVNVSTSKAEPDFQPPSPPIQQIQSSNTPNTNTDEDNDSESGMVIDTERFPEEPVTSTVGTGPEPIFSPGQATYSPGQPTYSPEHPTDSPRQPTYGSDKHQYSPGEPTYSPGEPTPDDPQEEGACETSGYGQNNSELSQYDQLQKEVASGYDQLQREIASGFDQLQREMANFNQGHSSNNETDTELIQPFSQTNSSYSRASIENVSDHISLTGKLEEKTPNVESPSIRGNVEIDKRNSPEPITEKNYDEEYTNDGCPNFSIYSRESKTVALTTDISLPASNPDPPNYSLFENTKPGSGNVDQITDESNSIPDMSQNEVIVEKTFGTGSDPRLKKSTSSSWNLGALYSDSEDESVVKKNNSFVVSDIKDMTEDILSEEERSYTPLLDENTDKSKEGLEGLDTEMISDEERNDFDESHELKTASDGDALEINAKESEIEFTRPEDFEEGEIVDKNKDKKDNDDIEGTNEITINTDEKNKEVDETIDGKEDKKSDKDKKKKIEKVNNRDKEENANKENDYREAFKKFSKNNKERNYRDKDKVSKKDPRSRSQSPEKSIETERDIRKKKEKRKELERYNVRAIIAEKPRPPPKDQFGRDLPSRSRSRSYTPPIQPESPVIRRSPSPIRALSSLSRRKSRSLSRPKTPAKSRRSRSRRKSSSKNRDKNKKSVRSRNRRTDNRSRSRSRGRKRERSKNRKRKRTPSKSNKRKKSKEKEKSRGGKRQRKSRSRSRKKSRSRSGSPRRNRREWTPSFSRSPSPTQNHMSPSWTPPRIDNSQALRNQNLTVILNNDAPSKKKDKRNKDRKKKDDQTSKRRRRERERTPPPSKEVFASGDNILVSVSFNNENETRDVSTRENRKRKEAAVAAEQQKKSKEKKNKSKRDLSGVKPVAIIDLERSPFQEILSSPKDIIVLSDSDNNENENRIIQTDICDSSQQVASPEVISNYTTGPKTPPEPSIKFSLLPKPPQLRAINNPLHDPLETIEEENPEEINNSMHKGPNTPPEEPPTSPPSSPDVYDPFEPTKSRSPSPEPSQVQDNMENEPVQEDLEKRTMDILENSGQTPDIIKSLTPPVADIQPADSQSSIPENCDLKSPEQRIGVVINQILQPANSKPVAQTTPFSSVPTSIITSTPVPSSIATSRINILNTSIIPSSSSIPQRIVLPNQVKSSPVKIPPTKAAVKSTPIKPMQSKSNNIKKKTQNGNSLDELTLDFESPYSPGSSDYDDLFEPPSENPTATVKPKSLSKPKTNHPKHQSTFDSLFGSPNMNKKKRSSKKTISSKTKHVGVKIDEDSLKILEDLPNSAVEMQVKDKFLKKLNRQERVVEEVKLVLKPYYNKKKITKNEYKDIMRRAVPKICHNKTGEINPIKIRQLIEAYVKKIKHSKKVTSSSSLPQKVT